jgi:hypothetical protein
MSWLFSQALVEEYSEESCSDGERFAPSSLTSTHAMYLSHGKTTDVSNLSRFGMTCELLTETRGAELLMSFLAAFHAKTFQAPEVEMVWTENEVGFGLKCGESFARYDQHSSSWKTLQFSLFGGLTEYLGAWPRWGTMQNGECWERATPDYLTNVKESGLLPTPLKSEGLGWKQSRRSDPRLSITNVINGGHQFRWIYIPLWNHSTPEQATVLAELMMDWPMQWTGLQELGTDKFQQWCKRHGTSCAKEPPPEHCGNGQHSIQQRQYAIPLDIKE